MQSTYKVFKGTTGLEDVLTRANEFVTRLGEGRIIAINTLIDPSESQITGIGSGISRGAYAESAIVIVWYWEPT